MLHNDVKKAVDNKDTKLLKYTFRDCLDGDPTFNEYLDDYKYCKDHGQLFEPHVELTKMSCDNVTVDYWVQLKNDFFQNPSEKRLAHMREVAKILYKVNDSQIKKNEKTISQPTASTIKNSVQEDKPENKEKIVSKKPVPTSNRSSYSGEVRRVSERVSNQNTTSQQNNEENEPKKASGVGSLIIAVIVIVLIVLLISQIIK